MSVGQVREFTYRRVGVVHFAQNAVAEFHHHFRGRCQPCTAPVPLQHGGTQFTLQLADLLRQRRLGDMHPGGRAPHVSGFGNGDQITKLTQFHGANDKQIHA